MTSIPNPAGIIKDGWYAKHTGESRLWGPVKNLRTAVQTWPDAIYQRVEEGVVVTSVDMRPTLPAAQPRHDEANRLAGLLQEARIYISQHTTPTVVEAATGSIVDRIDAALAERNI